MERRGRRGGGGGGERVGGRERGNSRKRYTLFG